jgi:hypothetical protein
MVAHGALHGRSGQGRRGRQEAAGRKGRLGEGTPTAPRYGDDHHRAERERFEAQGSRGPPGGSSASARVIATSPMTLGSPGCQGSPSLIAPGSAKLIATSASSAWAS